MLKNFLIAACAMTSLMYSVPENSDKDRVSARETFDKLFLATSSPYHNHMWGTPYASILGEEYRQWQSNKQDPQLVLSLIAQKALKKQRYFQERQAGKFNIEAWDTGGLFILGSILCGVSLAAYFSLTGAERKALEQRLASLGLEKRIEEHFYGNYIIRNTNFITTRQHSAAEIEIIRSDVERLRDIYVRDENEIVGPLLMLGTSLSFMLGTLVLAAGSNTAGLKGNAERCGEILQAVNKMIGAKQ
jgi:hypothetical protein